jgi:anthranilate phosphoribosyltransferase
MKHVAAVRKQLGIRTIFNLLGPLANPAGAAFQLLGVGRPEIRPLIASALRMLGTERSFVVSGHDGLGELTLAGTTHVTEVNPTGETEFSWEPEDFVIARRELDALQISGPDESVQMVRSVLNGEPGPARDIVIMNAAAGLIVIGHSATPREAATVAAEAIDRGAVVELLDQLVRLSHEPAQ